jgi:hypothetical protein
MIDARTRAKHELTTLALTAATTAVLALIMCAFL